MKGLMKVRAGVALAAAGALLSCAGTAQAARPASLGAGVPIGQGGVQLYDWSNYLSNGAGEITCPAAPNPPTTDCTGPPAPTTSADRLVRVFAYLQAKGVRNVELYGYPGNPFPGTNPATPNNTAGLQALRALGDQYGLRFPSRHGNIAAANWDNDIAASKILGQEYIGAADPPSGYNSSIQNALSTAQLLNQLGKRSVEAGLGPVYFHNHAAEFSTKLNDAGVLKPAWEILMDHTDPRYVKAQIDLFWAAAGTSNDNAYITSLFTKYSNRIIAVHMKDGINPVPNSGTSSLRELGNGAVNFAPILAAAKNHVKYYYYEYDPVTPGQNGGFNPFTSADTSLSNMQGDPAPTLYAPTTNFPSVPAGTLAANNVVPITVTNKGDAPLTITAVSLAADANDGGNQTRDDFQVVSQNCSGTGNVGPLAPAKAAVADDPSTPDINESAPAVPAGTCTVNVGFRPSRTNYTSVARLQFTSTGDDAVDVAALYGTSTGDDISTVGGDVPSVLMLSLPATTGSFANGASFGTFVPALARTYETALAATATSTAGNAALSVSDASTTAPGHLVNGAFSLPSPLNVRAIDSTNPTQAYAPMIEATSTPTTLFSWTGPFTSDLLTLGFRQAIGATDVLRAGNYNKTLTFTLATTTP